MLYSIFLSAAVAALQLGQTAMGSAIPSPFGLAVREGPDTSEIVPFPFDEYDDETPITKSFDAIVNIPDETLDAGEDAVKEWISGHFDLQTRDLELELEERQLWLSILKCAAAIAKPIAEGAFPLSKLRRIKDLIKFLGGARKTARMLLKAKSFKELLIIGGPELVELGEIFLNVSSIAAACFSAF